MATRSTIWIKNTDDTYKGVYCHWNGDIDHNGKILFEHYQDEERVEELISFGSLSLLAPEFSRPIAHTFNSPVPGFCVFYSRDRGEPLQHMIALTEYQTHKEMYNYIYQNGLWYFSTHKRPYQEITMELFLDN